MRTIKSFCLLCVALLTLLLFFTSCDNPNLELTSRPIQELSPDQRSLHHAIKFNDNMHFPPEVHELSNNIDRLLYMSDHVFIGKVTDEILFMEERNHLIYKVKVIDQWKGKIKEKEIDFFPTSSLAVDQTYLFFSEALDNPVYPRTEYSKIHHEGHFYVYDQLISPIYYPPDRHDEVHSGINLHEIKEYVRDSPYRHITLEPRFEKPYAIDRLSDRLLINHADAILHIRVEELEPINLYVSSVRGSILNHYKDEAYDNRQSFSLFLPPNLEVSEEYLIFLKGYKNYGTTLATRQGSIISKTDEPGKWRRFKQLLAPRSR